MKIAIVAVVDEDASPETAVTDAQRLARRTGAPVVFDYQGARYRVDTITEADDVVRAIHAQINSDARR